MQFQKYMPAGHCSKTVHYTDLNIWDGHRAFEDDPLTVSEQGGVVREPL